MKTEMRKYEFTRENKIICNGTVLHRIRALIDIDLGWKIVKAGELGGCAIVWGDAEVYGDSKVYGGAMVCGDAEVYGDSKVYGGAMVCGDAEVYGDTKIGGDAIVRRINHIADDACGSWIMSRFTKTE